MTTEEELLEKLAWMPCLLCHGRGLVLRQSEHSIVKGETDHLCSSCDGTGLRFTCLSQPCPCERIELYKPDGINHAYDLDMCKSCYLKSKHVPEQCLCEGRGRAVKPSDRLQVSDLAHVATKLDYRLVLDYNVDSKRHPPLDIVVAGDDKETILFSLAKMV